MFERILVPLDGSEHSRRALQTAVDLAAWFSSEVKLVHVYSTTVAPVIVPESTALTPGGIPVATSMEVAKMVEAAKDFGNRILSDAEAMVRAAGLKVDTELREGNTVQEILKVSKEHQCSLIVMGARGIGRIRELLMGSVSEGVIKHAPCPVLVVK